jgi:hypothetical protein
MIRVLLFSLLLIGANGVAAQNRNVTMLKLRLSDRSIISVNLDGQYIDRGTTSLTLDGIRPGMHRLEVYRDAGRRRPVRVYTGTLRLRPGTVNIGFVDVYNRGLRLRTRDMDERDVAGGESNRGAGNQGSRNDTPDNNDYSDNHGDDDLYNDQGRDNQNKVEGYGSFPKGRKSMAKRTPSAIAQDNLDDLRQRVSSLITDSDKEQLLKGTLKDQGIYTDQVRMMLTWLSFESTRLDFAKWALPLVIDRENYRKLEDSFEFKASKEEFREAVGSR